MIKINKVYSKQFLSEYARFVIDNVLYPNMQALFSIVPRDMQKNFFSFFTMDYFSHVLTASPDEFEGIIEAVYSKFPCLAERYCYSYLLKNVDIDSTYKDLDLNLMQGQGEFDFITNNVTLMLKELCDNKELYVTNEYVNQLSSDISRSKKKNLLKRIENAKRGRSLATDKLKKLYPRWINEFASCFNYELISEHFGFEIVQTLDLSICPYCGVENIQLYEGADISVRAELDHFYPKTRFPFLALSLYNLIPSGPICNQKHKKNNPMLGYMHPIVDGLDNDDVFSFVYFPGNVLSTLEIKIQQQYVEYKNKNIDFFKLNSLYDKNEDLREWFSNILELKDYLVEGGFDACALGISHPLFKLQVDLTRPITKVYAQKFKVEAMNYFFNGDFQISPQKM